MLKFPDGFRRLWPGTAEDRNRIGGFGEAFFHYFGEDYVAFVHRAVFVQLGKNKYVRLGKGPLGKSWVAVEFEGVGCTTKATLYIQKCEDCDEQHGNNDREVEQERSPLGRAA